jgi:hypothetical protein
VLKVYGFDSANNLLAKMADIRFPDENGAVFGDFQTSKTALDEHKKDKSDNSKAILASAAILIGAGSASVATAGVLRGQKGIFEAFQGAAGVAGAGCLMLTAMQTEQMQMSYLYRDLREFAESNNLRIGADVRAVISEYEAPDDLLSNFQRNVADNGPTINNTIKSIAGTSGAIAGGIQKNPYKLIGNAAVAVAMTTANLLPEKHISHETSINLGNEIGNKSGEITEPPVKKKSGVAGFIDGMIHNPQSIAGASVLFQQAAKFAGNKLIDEPKEREFYKTYDDLKEEYKTGYGSAVEEKDGAKTIQFNKKLEILEKDKIKFDNSQKAVIYDKASMFLLTAGFAAYTATKKHNGSKLDLDSVIEVCANMVNDYPKEQQKAVTQRLATFLGNHDYVHENVDELVSQINHKMAVLAQSPWAGNEKANDIVKFECATRLDGANQEQVEMAWQREKPNSNVLEAKKQSLEKLVAPELQPSAPAM